MPEQEIDTENTAPETIHSTPSKKRPVIEVDGAEIPYEDYQVYKRVKDSIRQKRHEKVLDHLSLTIHNELQVTNLSIDTLESLYIILVGKGFLNKNEKETHERKLSMVSAISQFLCGVSYPNVCPKNLQEYQRSFMSYVKKMSDAALQRGFTYNSAYLEDLESQRVAKCMEMIAKEIREHKALLKSAVNPIQQSRYARQIEIYEQMLDVQKERSKNTINL